MNILHEASGHVIRWFPALYWNCTSQGYYPKSFPALEFYDSVLLDSIFISTIAFHHSRDRPSLLVTAALHKTFQKQLSPTLICYLKKIEPCWFLHRNLSKATKFKITSQPVSPIPASTAQGKPKTQSVEDLQVSTEDHGTLTGWTGWSLQLPVCLLDKVSLGCIHDHKSENNCKQCK